MSHIEPLVIDHTQSVAIIAINHSEHRNALTTEHRVALRDQLQVLACDERISAVVLTSKASAFSAGQDLFEAKDFKPERIPSWIEEHMALYREILKFPKATVAAIDGCCVGAGLQIAMLCDLRVGSDRSFFALPELDDAIPCILGTWTLLDVIGRGRTTEMLFTNRRVYAPEALSWGILNKVVSADGILPEAVRYAQLIGKKSALAFRLTKQRITQLMLEGSDALTIHAIFAHMQAFATDEPKKAMEIFLERGRQG